MQDYRNDFLITILLNLKEIYSQLNNLTAKIENISLTYFNDFCAENNELISQEVNVLKENIKKIKQYNYQITEEINTWHQFSNNPQELGKTLYPIKFYFKKMRLNNKLQSINKEIYRISLENRLSKEKLKKIDSSIEASILKQIKNSGIYKEYEELLKNKEILISDLKYLMPTLPSPLQKINLNNIDFYLNNFQSNYKQSTSE